MRSWKTLFPLVLGLFLIGGGAAVLPAGEDGPRKPPREGDEPPPDAKRMKELMAKRREEGPPPDERDFVKKPMKPPDPGTMELAALQADLNVVDRAALASAQALMQAGKRDEAIAVAEKVATKSPDAEAAGVARLLAGRWYIEKGEEEAGNKNLRSVTGRAAALALAPLVEPLLKKQDRVGLVAACKDLVAAQPTGLDRCRVLKAMLDLLERPGPELSAELRAEVAGALSALVPYEEALAAKDALAKERAAAPRPPGPPFGPLPGFGPGMGGPGMGMFGPGMGGPGMGGGPLNEADLPEGLRGKAKALREMPP
jgi:tetratricopeptide (TPR) repeat protein